MPTESWMDKRMADPEFVRGYIEERVRIAHNAALEAAAKMIERKAITIGIMRMYQDGLADTARDEFSAAIRELKRGE